MCFQPWFDLELCWSISNIVGSSMESQAMELPTQSNKHQLWKSKLALCLSSAQLQRVCKEGLSYPACLRCLCISSQLTRYLLDRFLSLKYLVAVYQLDSFQLP
jgi:hypothetical protein